MKQAVVLGKACHPEGHGMQSCTALHVAVRSEGSQQLNCVEILRYAQDDKPSLSASMTYLKSVSDVPKLSNGIALTRCQ